MNEIEKQIMEEYARNYNIEAMSYELLGKMLDEKYVEQRLGMFGIDNMYIYGGTYLAVQLYRVGKKFATVKGVVDKSGRMAINEQVSVLSLDEFRRAYNGEKVIVTPLRYFQKIRKELEIFVDKKEIVDVGEFMMGIV